MRRIPGPFAILLFVCCISAPSAFAQFLSSIEGTVLDNTGAVVPGAKVLITDTQLGVSRTDTTNQSGFFRIGSIAASTYTIQIQANGFKTWNQKDLVLQVGETRTLSPVLEIGSVSTEVDVSATAAAINLTSPTTGSVVSSQTVQQTPLVGQNVYGLTALTPGITGNAVNGETADNYTNEYANNINAAGLRQEQNGYQIDGAYTNTPSRGGGTSISPNPEIVQSLKIRTNDFDAQKGRNGGATVDVFAKSGANDFHGTIDYYFLNDNLTSRTGFENAVPTFTCNEVGATFGAPIRKNKLFFYVAIDVLRSSTTSAGQYTVETQAFDPRVNNPQTGKLIRLNAVDNRPGSVL
jgi:Carboxypeptidase regulatory-like domain